MTDDDKRPSGLLSTRSAVILFCALITGVAASVLMFLARYSPYESVLVGAATGAGATKFFHWLIR